MDTERLYRKSMPGIMFIGVLFFGYLLFGGDANYVTFINKENLVFFIAILITTPIIGFIISTIAVAFLHKIQRHNFYINNPPSKKIAEIILNTDHPLFNKSGEFNNTELQEFYCVYQSYVRVKLQPESLRFLERRWNIYWIHLSNITAIFLGLFFSIFLTYKKTDNPIKINCWLLVGIGIGLIIYSIAALYQVYFIKKEVLQLEEEAIIRSKQEDLLKIVNKKPKKYK